VSIIIPLFNKVEYTRKCVEALSRTVEPGEFVEIVIVDNGSTDGTAAFLGTLAGDVVIVRNMKNLGFAKACNQGARVARGRDIVFLNNDTEPMPGWVDALLSASRRHRADICGAKLLYPNGTIQHAGVAIGPWKTGFHIFNGFPADDPAVNRYREFQAVTAACMLVRKSVFLDLGGFEEAYRNGYEDVDFCLRARKNGHRVLYVPESVLVHHEETTEGRKTHEQYNLSIFHERWDGTIEIDCDRIYAEEGMRRVVHPDGRWTLLRDTPVRPSVCKSPKSAGRGGEPVRVHRSDAEDPASRGRVLKKEKRYVEAIEAFRQARSRGDLSVLADIGDCLAKEGKLEEAGSAYLEAITEYPRDPRALSGLGILDLMKGNPARAERRFTLVLETDDRDATALCGMGLARKAGGGTGEAFGWFRRALDIDPVNVTALHELVKIAHELGRLEEVEGYMSTYLQYKPSDPHILFSLAGVFFKSGKWDEALNTLDCLAFFDSSYDGANELRERIASPHQVNPGRRINAPAP
jgi:GT2 family glycosyltransferase/Flp pilus assembly protein TadD